MNTREDLILNKSKFVKYIDAGTATYLLTRYERTVIVNATDDSGHITVVLPQESSMAGKIISVRLVTLATSNVLVKAHDGSATLATLATLDTSGDHCVLYCDGTKYVLLGGTYT